MPRPSILTPLHTPRPGDGKWHAAVVLDVGGEGEEWIEVRFERSGDEDTLLLEDVKPLPAGPPSCTVAFSRRHLPRGRPGFNSILIAMECSTGATYCVGGPAVTVY